MTKKIVFTLFFLLSSVSFAATKAKSDLSLRCISGQPTTSFLMWTEGDFAILKIIHHNGAQFMPIHEGVIVPNDFAFLKNKADLLTPMGSEIYFKYPLEKCKIYSPGVMSCSGGDRQTFNGIEIESLNFYTAKTHEETMGLSLDGWKATVSLYARYHGPVMDVSMNYAPHECQFNF